MLRPFRVEYFYKIIIIVLALTLGCRGGGGDSPPPAPLPPVLASFTPTAGPGGTQVTLKGSGFLGATQVAFGGIPARIVQLLHDGELAVTVPTGAATGLISVQGPSGTATSTEAFTVLQPPPAGPSAPVLASLSPASGMPGSRVVISGRGFTGCVSVYFGLAGPSSFHVDTDTRLIAWVPAHARTDQVEVTTRAGMGFSPEVFRVLPLPAPTLTSFLPASGEPGTRVVITGTGFQALTGVSFGGGQSVDYTLDSPTQITAVVPPNARPGGITVTALGGHGTSATAFDVPPPPPSIHKVHPARGAVGTPVILKGSGFLPGIRVHFHGTPALDVILKGSEELQVLVPAGSTTGPVSVQNATGLPVLSRDPFRVEAGGLPLGVFLDGWHITQSVQDYPGTVPLVAQRAGFLRVFLRANLPNSAQPSVRVTLAGGTPSTPWVKTIPAPAGEVPVTLREGELNASWNLPVPAAELRPGRTLQLELDPEGAVPGTDRKENLLQRALDIRTTRPLKVTLIPVEQANGQIGEIHLNGRTLADWGRFFRRLYPFADGAAGLEIQEGTPLVSTQTLQEEDHGPGFKLLEELSIKQVSEDALDQVYYGVVHLPDWGGTIGLTLSPEGWPAAFGTDSPHKAILTFTHEMGHVLGCGHAPCDVLGGNEWPRDDEYNGIYRGGRIGVYGFDVPARTLKDPETYTDIMAYCPNTWISDWHYKGILDFRAGNARTGARTGAAYRGPRLFSRSLRVSGRWKAGQVDLEPAFTLPAPSPFPEPGAFTLELLDRRGRVLLGTPFAIPPQEGGAFTLSLPVTPRILSALNCLRVSREGKVLAVRKAAKDGKAEPSGRSGKSRKARKPEKGREPTCVALRPGEAYLSWDPVVYPKVMVQDPMTGSLLAFGDTGALELVTRATQLELHLSDGLRSHRRLIQVKEPH